MFFYQSILAKTCLIPWIEFKNTLLDPFSAEYDLYSENNFLPVVTLCYRYRHFEHNLCLEIITEDLLCPKYVVGPKRTLKMQHIQKHRQNSVTKANICALKFWSFFHQKFPIILLELSKIVSNCLHLNYALYRFIYWQKRINFINIFAEIVFNPRLVCVVIPLTRLTV